MLGFDHRFALEDGDLVLLEQELCAPPELVHHRLLALQHRGPIDLHAVGLEAEHTGGANLVRQLGGMEEGLGRNAAPMQAGATDLLLLDDRDLEPQLGSTDGADISGGAAADDGYVERLIGHTSRL